MPTVALASSLKPNRHGCNRSWAQSEQFEESLILQVENLPGDTTLSKILREESIKSGREAHPRKHMQVNNTLIPSSKRGDTRTATAMPTQRPVSLYIWSVLVLMAAFVCLVLLPFYGNNINSYFVVLEKGNDLPQDIQTFVPFSWPVGMHLRIIALMMLVLVPVYVSIMSIRSFWILWNSRQAIERRSMVFSLGILISSLLLLLISSPDWWKIGYWLAD